MVIPVDPQQRMRDIFPPQTRPQQAALANDPAMSQFKRARDVRLQQHAQYAQRLDQAQDAVNARGQDLALSDRLLKLLDPSLPKPARDFLFKEMARSLRIDPKGETTKEIGQMLTSLDPESLQSLRSMFSQQLSGASPGQIQQTARGILTGQIPMNAVLSQVRAVQSQGQGQQGQPGQTPPAPEQRPAQQPTSRQPTISNIDEAPITRQAIEEQPPPVRSMPENRTTPPVHQEVDSSFLQALGLDPSVRRRASDLTAAGITPPLNAEDQRRSAREITDQTTGLSASLRNASLLAELMANSPDRLSLIGRLQRGLDDIKSGFEGLLQAIGASDETDLDAANLRDALDDTANNVAQVHNFEMDAQASAVIESTLLEMAYNMVIARGIPGNRITNAILTQQLRILGESQSPKQFRAVIANTMQNRVDEFDELMQRRYGVSGNEVLARKLSPETIDRISAITVEQEDEATGQKKMERIRNPILPDSLEEPVRERGRQVLSGEEGEVIAPPQSPTPDEETRYLQNLAEEERQLARFLSMAQHERAQRAEERAERSLELSEERFDFAKEQAEEAEERRRGEAIARAFREFGAGIAAAFRGASVGGGGLPAAGGQDIRAFQLSPAPRRTPPAIPRGLPGG